MLKDLPFFYPCFHLDRAKEPRSSHLSQIQILIRALCRWILFCYVLRQLPECLCIPKFKCWILPRGETFRCGACERWLDHKENGISVLFKNSQIETTVWPFHEAMVRRHCLWARIQTEHHQAKMNLWHKMLGFQISKNKILLFITFPTHGVWIRQPWSTVMFNVLPW